jgi:HD-like signal output (HDOD) protein
LKFECQNCHNDFDIPDERLPKKDQVRFPCPVCKAIIELDLRPQAANQNHAEAKEMLRGSELKKKILRSINDLPPMPQTVIKAREIMQDEHSDFKELSKVLETDQAIAAKVLRIANSSYYGMAGKVSSIKHASVVLGFKALGELITVAGTSEVLGKELSGYKLEAGALWQHSLGVAQGARLIAKKKSSQLVDDAFAAGLIHDVGKLVLDPYILDREELFNEFLDNGQGSFLQAEEEILGFGHPEIAAELCKLWNIPRGFTLAIRYHHKPSRSNDDKLAYIVHLADIIAMMSGLGVGIDGMCYEIEDGAMDFVGINEEELHTVMAQAAEFAMEFTS